LDNSASFTPHPVIITPQEAQLMPTNPRDVLRGQSSSPNTVPFHMLGISLLCNSNSVFKTVFPISVVKKCRDFEIRVRSHSRSLKVVKFYRLDVVSY